MQAKGTGAPSRPYVASLQKTLKQIESCSGPNCTNVSGKMQQGKNPWKVGVIRDIGNGAGVIRDTGTGARPIRDTDWCGVIRGTDWQRQSGHWDRCGRDQGHWDWWGSIDIQCDQSN